MPEQDDYVTGLKDMGPIKVNGLWSSTLAAALSTQGPMMIHIRSSRWFGVRWYLEAYACPLVSITRSDEPGVLTMVSEAPYEIRRAAWWRRLGYYLIARPLDLIAWHGYQRWRRDDEED